MTWSTDHPDTPLYLYALVDAGQDKHAWHHFQRLCPDRLPLLTAEASALSDFSPHLLQMGVAARLAPEVIEALAKSHATTAFTLLCSSATLAELHAHLAKFIDVQLPGNMEMVLAFWDPAILGTLIGQADDDSLHVPGPVLNPKQLPEFLKPVVAWWYCDREARWHRIEASHNDASTTDEPAKAFTLTQEQEDALVEASVPDQVLYHIALNRPHLFDEHLPHFKRYRFVRVVLAAARKLGLEGMRDLASFAALCLIYRQRIESDPEILQLLEQVQRKAISFDQALELMPE